LFWLKTALDDGDYLVELPYSVAKSIYEMLKVYEMLKEKQEPVVPDCVTSFDGTTRHYLCVACGHEIMKNDRWQIKYCQNCGKAVKWE
jgi:hypothetical protein